MHINTLLLVNKPHHPLLTDLTKRLHHLPHTTSVGGRVIVPVGVGRGQP